MSTYFPSQLGNNDLKWETTSQLDLMMDATIVVLTETLEHITVISETVMMAL